MTACKPGCRCGCDEMCGCHDQLHPWLEPMRAQTLADIADIEMDEALDVARAGGEKETTT